MELLRNVDQTNSSHAINDPQIHTRPVVRTGAETFDSESDHNQLPEQINLVSKDTRLAPFGLASQSGITKVDEATVNYVYNRYIDML